MTKAIVNPSTHYSRLLAALFVIGLSAVALSACNTVEGAGEDIESAGESIQDGADEN